MRILAVSNAAWPVIGGIEVLLDQLLPALVRRGHEVTLLTSALRDDEWHSERNGVTVHRAHLMTALVRRDPGLLSRERQRVRRLLTELKPDLVHAHDIGPNLWAIVKGGTTAPIVTTMHCGLRTSAGVSPGSTTELLRASRWITGVSESVVAEVIEAEPSLADRVSVIDNGVPHMDRPDDAVVPGRVLCLGRLVERKGFDVALRALAIVAPDRPHAHVVVAGEGPERARLEALAAELGVADRVEFLGGVVHADVARLIAAAQLVAIPSRAEGQPLVALEAAAVGRPVVSTSVDGLGVVVRDGVTGLTVPLDDVDALARAIGSLLDDPVRCDALGAAARAHVVSTFDFDGCVDAYEALFERVTSPPHTPL